MKPIRPILILALVIFSSTETMASTSVGPNDIPDAVHRVEKKSALIMYYYFERLAAKDPTCQRSRPRDLHKVLSWLGIALADYEQWKVHRPYRYCRLVQRHTLLDCPQAQLTKADIESCKDLRPASARQDWPVYIGVMSLVLSATAFSLLYQMGALLFGRRP